MCTLYQILLERSNRKNINCAGRVMHEIDDSSKSQAKSENLSDLILDGNLLLT
jgi:hypothetical protein